MHWLPARRHPSLQERVRGAVATSTAAAPPSIRTIAPAQPALLLQSTPRRRYCAVRASLQSRSRRHCSASGEELGVETGREGGRLGRSYGEGDRRQAREREDTMAEEDERVQNICDGHHRRVIIPINLLRLGSDARKSITTSS